MLQQLSQKILKWCGWSITDTCSLPDRCVICIAPHTSNWDFVWGMLYKWATHLHISFFMKKEWFRFPMGGLMRRLGGIPVNRSRKTSLTDAMAMEFSRHEHFCVGITPEGTRKPNADWKKGFYFIALKAEVPIVIAKIDYATRQVGCVATFTPTGDVEADLRQIKAYYRNVTAKKPKNFLC